MNIGGPARRALFQGMGIIVLKTFVRLDRTFNVRWTFLHRTRPSSLQDLLLETLGGHLGLQHAPDALLPCVLQRLDLAQHALLLGAPQRLDLLVLLPRLCQLRLDLLQDVLELRVAHQPGVLAKLLQQAQLRQPPLDVL